MKLSKYKESLEESAVRERIPQSIYPEFKEEILRNAHGKCLEVGCGDGRWTKNLNKYTDEVVSLDLSEGRLKTARQINPDTAFILSDARSLPFKDGCFDCICALEVIEHLPSYSDHHRFLKEIRRTLKKDGILFISTPNSPLFNIYSKIRKESHTTHYSELNYFQFKRLLALYFKDVKIKGKFGWLSVLWGFGFVRKLHHILSKVTFLCKSLLSVCTNKE